MNHEYNIGGVRTLGNILFVSPQPQQVIENLGFPRGDYVHWFESALGIAEDSLRSVDAINDNLPNLEDITAVFVGGSGYSAYETNRWQVNLEHWIGDVVRREIPLMAVCYGHQALMKGQGGVVNKDPNGQEFGPVTVQLTPEGENHPIFQGLGKEIVLYSSHGDIVSKLPENARLLASNESHPIQAVAIGNNIVGIQPHPEFREDIMVAIAKLRARKWLDQGVMTREDVDRIVGDIKRDGARAKYTGERILQNFLNGPVKTHLAKTRQC